MFIEVLSSSSLKKAAPAVRSLTTTVALGKELHFVGNEWLIQGRIIAPLAVADLPGSVSSFQVYPVTLAGRYEDFGSIVQDRRRVGKDCEHLLWIREWFLCQLVD
jgi:hypothetical protein